MTGTLSSPVKVARILRCDTLDKPSKRLLFDTNRQVNVVCHPTERENCDVQRLARFSDEFAVLVPVRVTVEYRISIISTHGDMVDATGHMDSVTTWQ